MQTRHLAAALSLSGALAVPLAAAAQNLPAAGAAVSTGVPAPAGAIPNPTLYQLTQRLMRSEAAVSSAVKSKGAGSAAVEDLLAQNYEDLQLLCKKQFDELEQDSERYRKAEARTNLAGNLLALLGSVATYAPGKTLLMGLGISSGSSGSVSAGITQFFSNRSATDETKLSILRNQLVLMFDRYDGVEPDRDPTGARRRAIMARAKGICMGLTSLDGNGKSDAGTEAGAAAPAAPASAASAAASG